MMDRSLFEDVGEQEFPDLDQVVFIDLWFPSFTVATTRTDWMRRVTGREAG